MPTRSLPLTKQPIPHLFQAVHIRNVQTEITKGTPFARAVIGKQDPYWSNQPLSGLLRATVFVGQCRSQLQVPNLQMLQ